MQGEKKMRIFKQTCMDLKSDILFKDTLNYIEEVFEKLGISYDNMGFMFSGVTNDKLEKIVKTHPSLEKYICPHNKSVEGSYRSMSSGRTDENGNYTLRIDKSEHETLRELVKKTPRPYSFGAISIFLDNVRWFQEVEVNTTPCLVNKFSREGNVPPSAYYPQCYMSNCVTLTKQFDYGKKFNPVWFSIEVGDEKIGIIDTTKLEERLSTTLGKPFGTRYYHTKYHFYFNDTEKKHLAQQDKEFAVTFNPLTTELLNLINHAEGIQHIRGKHPTWYPWTSASRVSGLSLVKALKKVLPAKTHTYQNDGGGFFTVERKNENNHSFVLSCGLSPDFKLLRAEMVISGHNFKHELGCAHDIQTTNVFESIYPNTQKEVEYHIANLATALKEAEDQLSAELLRLYGKSVV